VGETLIEPLPADDYPNLKTVGMELMASNFDYAAEFEWGLDVILDGLAAHSTA
jgi:hypothetical protein